MIEDRQVGKERGEGSFAGIRWRLELEISSDGLLRFGSLGASRLKRVGVEDLTPRTVRLDVLVVWYATVPTVPRGQAQKHLLECGYIKRV